MSAAEDEPITEAQVAEAQEPTSPAPEPGPERDVGDEPDEADVPREEPQEPGPEPVEGDEPEPEAPSEPAGPTPEEMEAKFKAIHKAFNTYTGRVSAILEEMANELLPCPLCSDGVPGHLHLRDAGHVAEETKRAVLTFMGVTQEADYKDDPNHKACPDCDGLTKLKTGSHHERFKLIDCGRCKGSGYVPPPGVNVNGQVDQPPALVPVGGGEDFRPQEEADAWGSPRLLATGLENPNYGRMPQYKDPTLP